MCYTIKAKLEAQLKRAKKYRDASWVDELEKQINEREEVDKTEKLVAFAHPKLLIYTDQSPEVPTPAMWGLVPSWIKTEKQKNEIWNKTVNARGETLFDKPSFKPSACKQRCIIYIDGYYEHQHLNKQKTPHFIQQKNTEPLALAGIYNHWQAKNAELAMLTFCIVTTTANRLLQKIHNNPHASVDSRMPIILNEQQEMQWLSGDASVDSASYQEVLKPYPEEFLKATAELPPNAQLSLF